MGRRLLPTIEELVKHTLVEERLEQAEVGAQGRIQLLMLFLRRTWKRTVTEAMVWDLLMSISVQIVLVQYLFSVPSTYLQKLSNSLCLFNQVLLICSSDLLTHPPHDAESDESGMLSSNTHTEQGGILGDTSYVFVLKYGSDWNQATTCICVSTCLYMAEVARKDKA